MAELICVCGAELAQVPGRCYTPQCMRMWPSRAALEKALADQEETELISVLADDGSADDGGLPPQLCSCGAPAPVSGACPFCGQPAPATSNQVACLVVRGRLIELPERVEIEIGRHSPWVQLSQALEGSQGVSRRQASIRVDGDRVQIRDLQSKNGTWIDGREVIGGAVTRHMPVRLGLGMSVEAEVRVAASDECFEEWTGEQHV